MADQPGVESPDDSIATHGRLAVPHQVAFWLVAFVFMATMIGTALPTPLYVIY